MSLGEGGLYIIWDRLGNLVLLFVYPGGFVERIGVAFKL